MKALRYFDIVIQMLLFVCSMTVVCCFKSNQITRSSSQGHTRNWLKEKKHRRRIFTVLTEYESIIASLCVCVCVRSTLSFTFHTSVKHHWELTSKHYSDQIKKKNMSWFLIFLRYCISPLTRKQTEKEREGALQIIWLLWAQMEKTRCSHYPRSSACRVEITLKPAASAFVLRF